MTSLFVISACEKAEIQKPLTMNVSPIDSRSSCSHCPISDCCCSVEFVSGGPFIFSLCGSTHTGLSTTPCGPFEIPGMAGCPDVTASYYQGPFNISSSAGPEIFCVPTNASFMLQSSSGSGSVRITCQHGQASPQSVTPTITSPNKYFFTTNGDCELSGC